MVSDGSAIVPPPWLSLFLIIGGGGLMLYLGIYPLYQWYRNVPLYHQHHPGAYVLRAIIGGAIIAAGIAQFAGHAELYPRIVVIAVIVAVPALILTHLWRR